MLEQLRTKLKGNKLPGQAAQALMAPPGRGEFPPPAKDARLAAVLLLLFQKNEKWHLLFIQRTAPPGDHHGGQISFPGGSVDPGDTDAIDTALRETEEEVGIPRSEIEVLGELTRLYIPVSNFIVDPVLGLWTPGGDYEWGESEVAGARYVVQQSEVARVLELPLEAFRVAEARKVGDRKLTSGVTAKSVPYYLVGEEVVWGASSMMLAELLALL